MTYFTDILVDTRVLLRHGLVPDDVASGKPQDDIDMTWPLCTLVHIVT